MTTGLVILIFSFTKLVTGNKEGFIVGGDFVDNIRDFPHVAFLELASDESVYICGSSVLTQYILITAAHCLEDADEVTAYVGNVNRDHGKPYKVGSRQIHAKYNSATVIHDVALCKLRKALKLAHNVKRVLLMKHPPKAKIAYVAGWGAVEEQYFTDSTKLKVTKQRLWTRKACSKVLNRPPKGTICGGQRNYVRDFASKGDSGSGLLINNRILVGLVSYKNMQTSRSLVVYTDTAYYYNWIQRTAKRLTCS